MTCLARYLGVVCVLLAGRPAPAQVSASEQPKPTLLYVVVTDPDGRPISEADVSWSAAGADLRRGRRTREQQAGLQTDLNGFCSIELPAEGAYRIVVKREGYLDADDLGQFEHIETVDVGLSKTVKVFVDLVRSGTFQGTVYLEEGQPLSGATVRLQAATPSWTGTTQGSAPRWLVAKTDEHGNYAFPIVPPSRYGMWIAPPEKIVRESLTENERHEWTGYPIAIWHSSVEELRRIVPVEVAPGEDVQGYNVVLRKSRIYPFQGTLREWSGAPLGQARVGIRVGGTEPVTLLEPRPVNSLTGEFEFPALPDGPCWLLVYRNEAHDSPPYAVPFNPGQNTLEKNKGQRVVLRVPPWDPVTGRVVVVTPGPAGADKNAQTAGGLQAEIVRPRYGPWSQPAPVQLWLTPGANGVLARGDTVQLRSSDIAERGSIGFPTMLLAPDAYQFRIQAPEPWYIASVRSADVNVLQTRVFTVAPQERSSPVEVVIEVRQGGMAVEGLVVSERSEPLPHSAMCAMALNPTRRAQPGGSFCVRTDDEGAFRSRWMSPGNWRVWALTRKPHDNPASSAFQEKYDRAGRTLTVPENGILFRQTLVATE